MFHGLVHVTIVFCLIISLSLVSKHMFQGYVPVVSWGSGSVISQTLLMEHEGLELLWHIYRVANGSIELVRSGLDS